MNNKRVFSVNMFWHTFKGLKFIGALAAVMTAVIGVGPVVSEILSVKSYIDSEGYLPFFDIGVVGAVEEHGYIVVLMMGIALFMGLNVWKFLNKRNSSDLYHSIPHTRICVFISKITAVILWMLIIVAVSYIALLIVYMFGREYYIIDEWSLFRVHVAGFISGLLVLAAVSMACAVTGNMFNNVVLTGIILFFPRALIGVVTTAIESMTAVVNSATAIPFVNSNQNMVTGVMVSVIYEGMGLQKIVLSLESNYYTLTLALIYIVIALVLFNRRKSECAEVGTYGKKTGFLIGCIISMLIATVGSTNLLVSVNTNKDASNIELMANVYSAFSMFLLAFIGVFVYEFFSSRENVLRKLKKSLAPTVSGWAVAIVAAGVTFVVSQEVLNYTPDKSDIKYVNIDMNVLGDGGMFGYYENIISQVDIDDEGIKEIVAEALKTNIEQYKDGTYRQFLTYDTGKQNAEEYLQYNVCINDGLIKSYRTLYFSAKQRDEITKRITNVKEVRDAYYDLPEYDDAYVRIMSDGKDFTDDMTKDIYNTMIDELQSIKFEDYYDMVNNVHMDASALSMNFMFTRESYVYSDWIRPSRNVLPKTAAKYYEYCNQTARGDKEIYDKMQAVLEECIKTKRPYVSEGDEDLLIQFYMPGYVSQMEGDFYYIRVTGDGGEQWGETWKNDTIPQILLPAVLEGIRTEKQHDYMNPNKILARVNYRDKDNNGVTGFIVLDGDIAVDWENAE